MDATLTRSRYEAEFPLQKHTARNIRSALRRLLNTALKPLISPPDDLPLEFFRYPLP